MWIVAGVGVIVIVMLAIAFAMRKKRSAKPDVPVRRAQFSEPLPDVHALDDALRTVESLTDAKGSSLLDQVDREGRTIRDRLASGEAHLDSLRQPDDTGPLLRRVLDEVAGADPATGTSATPDA